MEENFTLRRCRTFDVVNDASSLITRSIRERLHVIKANRVPEISQAARVRVLRRFTIEQSDCAS